MYGPDMRRMVAAVLAGLAVAGLQLASVEPAAAATTLATARDWRAMDGQLSRAKSEMQVDPAAARESARAAEAQIILQKPGRDRTLALVKSRWLQGEADLRLNDPEDAAPLLRYGLEQLSGVTHPFKLKADLLLSRGFMRSLQTDVAGALQDYQSAYRISRALGDNRSQAVALLCLASLYRDAGDASRALAYDREANEIYSGDTNLSFSASNGQGNSLAVLNRFAEADAQYRVALQLAKKSNSLLLQAQIYGNIAKNLLQAGDLDKAHAAIVAGLKIAENPIASPFRSPLLGYAAQEALQRDDLAQAKHLIGRSFAGVDLTDPSTQYRNAHQTAYEIYKRTGDYELALEHLEARKRIDDHSASLASSANTALMAARFDYTNQNLRIAKLKADELQRSIAYERAHARSLRMMFVGAAIAMLVIISMLVFGLITIRRSRNQVRAANIDLGETNSALAKALAAKTEFLATTSHEIRTPLNGILGMTQVMLADRGLPVDVRDRLGVVHSAGTTMRALVDDILDVAKMETGNMTIERAPVDVCAVLRESARIWEDQARARGLEFILSLDACPAVVEGDAVRLRQMVFNLLSNAIKFTERGSVTLHGATDHRDGGDRVLIEVRDTGVGIPAEKQDEVFESFKQADASTTRRFGGTGLGLAICRNLARAMDGDVHLTSVPGKGTTFTIDLPLVFAAIAPVAAEPAHRNALLIVDRNPINRSMLRALLEERAGVVDLASSLDEAADRLAKGGVARVLIDDATARAADGDVFAAVRAIAKTYPSAELVLLWTGAMAEDQAAAGAAGIHRLIAKPIAGPALRDMLFPANAMGGDERTAADLVSNAAWVDRLSYK